MARKSTAPVLELPEPTCEAEKYIDGFAEYMRSHAKSHETSLDKLADALSRVRGASLESFSSERREEEFRAAISHLVETYIVRRMSASFPLLEPSLFTAVRWIGVRFDREGEPELFESRLLPPTDLKDHPLVRWVKVPFLCKIDNRTRGPVDIGRTDWPKQRHAHCHLHVDFPGAITEAEMQWVDRAQAELYRIYADLLSDERLACHARESVEKPSVAAYWIPTLSSIYVTRRVDPPKRDPALVLQLWDHHFLCCMWDAGARAEEPLEAIVREFSVGGKVNRSLHRRVNRGW